MSRSTAPMRHSPFLTVEQENRRFRRLPYESLALLAVCIAALILHLQPLNNFSLDYQDEGAYWQSLRAMAAGSPLFSIVFSSQPPFFLISIFPFYMIFGQTLGAARLAIVFFALVGLTAVYYIGRASAGRWAGIVACALLSVDPLYLAEAHTVQADMPSESLALVGVALALSATRNTGHGRQWRAAASGVAIGLGVMTKLFALIALVPVALYFLLPLFAISHGTRRYTCKAQGVDVRGLLLGVLFDLAFVVAGLVVVCVAVLAPFVPVLGLVYDQVIRFHQIAEQTYVNIGWRGNVQLIRDTVADYYSIPYLLLLPAGMALAAWRRAWEILPPLSWFVVSLGLLVHQQPLSNHHVVLLAPALALIAGIALPLARHHSSSPVPPTPEDYGLETTANNVPHLHRVAQGRIQTENVLTYSALALTVVATLAGLTRSIEANGAPILAPSPPGPAAQFRMARALHNRTRSGEIVVTDGQYIAGLAGRSVLPQLTDTSQVRIIVGSRDPRYFSLRQLEDLIVRNHVHAILFATGRFDILPPFRMWVKQHYRLIESFDTQGALYMNMNTNMNMKR